MGSKSFKRKIIYEFCTLCIEEERHIKFNESKKDLFSFFDDFFGEKEMNMKEAFVKIENLLNLIIENKIFLKKP